MRNAQFWRFSHLHQPISSQFYFRMKNYQLEYRMKRDATKRELNQQVKTGTLRNKVPNDIDEFLESAEEFARKSQKKITVRNPFQARPARRQQVHPSPRPDVTPGSLKKSLEVDRSHNLEYWRKEAFRYQEQVFILERKNSELSTENGNLLSELKLRNFSKKTQTQSQDVALLRQLHSQQISDLTEQLLNKSKTIKQLQKKVKEMSQYLIDSPAKSTVCSDSLPPDLFSLNIWGEGQDQQLTQMESAVSIRRKK